MSGSVGEKFPGQTGSLEFFTALPDKIFCLGLSSHSWPSGKFVYARYARYTNSNALLRLRLSSIDVFCPHFVRAKNRPSGLERLSSPRQILLSWRRAKNRNSKFLTWKVGNLCVFDEEMQFCFNNNLRIWVHQALINVSISKIIKSWIRKSFMKKIDNRFS